MTDALRDFTLFLLETMSGARALQARGALGFTPEAALAARRRVEAAGLLDLVRTLDRFERVLGPADEARQLADGGRRLCYSLDPWPSFWFAIEGDARSIVSDLRFVRRPDAVEPRLEAWGLLLEDVEGTAPVRAVVDEWFPHKALLLRQQGRSQLLRFEYGLLQDIDDLSEPEAAALERGAGVARG